MTKQAETNSPPASPHLTGDRISGKIGRDELAAVVVGACSNPAALNKTVEVRRGEAADAKGVATTARGLGQVRCRLLDVWELGGEGTIVFVVSYFNNPLTPSQNWFPNTTTPEPPPPHTHLPYTYANALLQTLNPSPHAQFSSSWGRSRTGTAPASVWSHSPPPPRPPPPSRRSERRRSSQVGGRRALQTRFELPGSCVVAGTPTPPPTSPRCPGCRSSGEGIRRCWPGGARARREGERGGEEHHGYLR
jgi:hypothetical protein